MDLLLITIDCLRADHLSCYGYPKQTTPNIDKLADESIVFDQFISVGPHTAFAFPAILTSTYPLMFNGPYNIDTNRTTIAEILQKNGYKTWAFHSNPYLAKTSNYSRGFDFFWDSMDYVPRMSRLSDYITDNAFLSWIKDNRYLSKFARRMLRYLNLKSNASAYVDASVINEKALQNLEKNTSDFAIWIHYMDAHYPYPCIPEYYKKFSSEELSIFNHVSLHAKMVENPTHLSADEIQTIKALYDSRINYVDRCLGELISEMKAMGVFDNTLIVITADHGEAFCEHNDYGHNCGSTSATLVKLYDELLHVPLIIRHPDLGTSRIKSQASSIDLPPTIIDILGLEKEPKWLGESFYPLLKGMKQTSNPYAFSEYFIEHPKFGSGRIVSCRKEDWKFIYNSVNGNHELYNLVANKKETKNLYDSETSTANFLKKQIFQHIEKNQHCEKITDGQPEDKEVKSRLKALGYID